MFCALRQLSVKVMSDPPAKRPKMDGQIVNEVQRKSTSPKRTCNLSMQNFSAITDLGAFVDKTLFLKAFLEADEKSRRFGKSTNMDMVKEFVTGNKKLFEDNQLKIWKEEREFFNKYCQEDPVILVDFKNANGKTENDLLLLFSELIHNAFNDHLDLIKVVREIYSWSDEKLEDRGSIKRFEMYWKGEVLSRVDVIHGLKKLSQCLNVYHGKPVYAFIDEYDVPIMAAIINTYPGDGILKETINLIHDMMCIFLKGNEHVERGLINACFRIPGMPSNIKYYEFLRDPEFSPYFGFTDKKVNSLFERDEFVTLRNDEVRKWYGGYRLLHTNEYVIYNSYSILRYLRKSRKCNKPRFNSYWVEPGIINHLEGLFGVTEIRRLIENLIDGEEVEIRSIRKFSKDDIITLQLIHHNLIIGVPEANLFLQFLTEHGYLNVVSTGDETSTILAPNNEMKELLNAKCYDADLFPRPKYQLSPEKIRNYVDALDSSLQQRDKNAFIRFARAVSELFDGTIMPKGEDEFHCILFTLAYNVKRCGVQRELSAQGTREETPHLLVILSDVGMILKLKFEVNSSEEAHTQILTQGYVTAFNDYRNVTVKILLGVHITKERKVSLTYTVDNSAKQTVTSND